LGEMAWLMTLLPCPRLSLAATNLAVAGRLPQAELAFRNPAECAILASLPGQGGATLARSALGAGARAGVTWIVASALLPDPSTMSHAEDPWYIRYPDGRVRRAASTDTVRRFLGDGAIPLACLVRRSADEEWMALEWTAEFADLIEQLTSSSPA